MNIKKALKEKNKLKAKINDGLEKARRYNLAESEIQRPYDPNQLIEEVRGLINEMIALKSKIQVANKEVYHKIFRLSELKNLAAKLRYMSCDPERYESSGNNYFQPAITTKERDRMLLEIEQEIDQIQEELDQHNYSTTI
jgi:hypothetical protein